MPGRRSNPSQGPPAPAEVPPGPVPPGPVQPENGNVLPAADAAIQPNNNPIGFVVASRYDPTWIADYEVVLLKSKRLELETTSDEDRIVRPDHPASTTPDIAFAVLLDIKKATENKTDLPFRKVVFGKKVQTQTTYKCMYSFGDLSDPAGGSTISLIEKNNSDHMELHRRDMQKKDFKIGAKVVILCPQIVGVLKNGSTLIQTSRPLQIVSAPSIPQVPYSPHTVQSEKKFFVLKAVQLYPVKNNFPTPICTTCSADTCDRLRCSDNPNAPCGCFTQFSRNTGNAKNVCLKTTFYIQANTATLIPVTNFTSLRFSRFLFQNEIIVHDIEQLHNSAVTNLIARKWRPALEYVNQNGGFTVLGWMVRAKKQTEENINASNDHDGDLLHESIKTNICYVYPTTLTHRSIPEDRLICHSEINGILTAPLNGVNNRDASNDNL